MRDDPCKIECPVCKEFYTLRLKRVTRKVMTEHFRCYQDKDGSVNGMEEKTELDVKIEDEYFCKKCDSKFELNETKKGFIQIPSSRTS